MELYLLRDITVYTDAQCLMIKHSFDGSDEMSQISRFCISSGRRLYFSINRIINSSPLPTNTLEHLLFFEMDTPNKHMFDNLTNSVKHVACTYFYRKDNSPNSIGKLSSNDNVYNYYCVSFEKVFASGIHNNRTLYDMYEIYFQ